jgi:4-hydroxythreonine-4-phosphate dehydrogenase
MGSGGLARALPRHLPLSATTPSFSGSSSLLNDAVRRPVLLVVGSRTSTARDQVRALVDSGAVHVIAEARDLATGSNGPIARSLLDAVLAHLGDARDVVVSIGAGTETTIRDDARLAQVLGEWLRPAALSIGGLVLTGGDTALGVLRAWGVTSLDLVDEVEPGVPLATTRGALSLPVVTKAGGFGGPTTLSMARDRLKARLAAIAG